MRVAVLVGGVGVARFLRGLIRVLPPADVTAVVNTGDDTVLHGLEISPDLDTITYTLAEAIDPERGRGLDGETWRTMEALDRYVAVRPDGSTAAPTWFNLGDRDLATHFYRTARLREGSDLTTVTGEIAAGLGSRTVAPAHDRPPVPHGASARRDGRGRIVPGLLRAAPPFGCRLRRSVRARR